MREGESAAVQETFERLGFRFAWRIAQKACLPDFAESRPCGKSGRSSLPASRRDDSADGDDSRAKTLVMGTNYSDFLGGANNAV